MGTPVALPERFINVTGATLVIGTAPNTASLVLTGGTLTQGSTVDDMTNNTGGGWEEDVFCTQNLEGDITIAYVPAEWPSTLVNGAMFPVNIAVPSGPTITGNMRFTNFGRPMFEVKSGFKVSAHAKGQGMMTVTG